MLQVTSRKQLAKIRREAKKRGFRVLRDGTGNFSLINLKVEPPRPLLGVDHVPLWVIEQVIFAPLPEPPPRRRRMARLSGEAVPTVQATTPVEMGAPAHAQAHHSFLSLVEALRTKGGLV
ncbi:MAG TPA: hypothetical protein VKJ47_13995 [Candidatus Binatia bacterium]|nr:hypothetical protein [Candidatus Binatia bacterium]